MYGCDDMREQCESVLGPDSSVQTAALLDVGTPVHELRVADALLGFVNSSAADSMQHEFVPHLIGGSQFFGAALLVRLTSLAA